MKITELLNSKKFHIPSKDTFTITEVYQLIEDHTKFAVGAIEPEVDKKFSSITAQVETLKAEKEELASSTKEVEELKVKYEKELKEKSEALKPYLKQEKEKSAIDLLKGKVLPGAEVDAFNLIEEEIKDLEIDDKNKDEVLKPIIEKLYEKKPYFKVNGEVHSDDKKLLKEEKHGEKETQKVTGYTPVVDW